MRLERVGRFSVFELFATVGSSEVTVHFVNWLPVVVAAMSSVSCASDRAPVWTDDGMYLANVRTGALFLTPSPPDLHHYRGVVLEEIQISTTQQSRDLKPFEEERLKRYVIRRLERVFGRNGWPIVETPGEDVLRVRVAVKNLQLRKWRHSHDGKIVSNASLDKITIMLELRDAITSDRRLWFGRNRRLPFGVYNGSDSVSIRRVEDAFYDFSIDIWRHLDQVQRGEFPPPSRPSGTKSAATRCSASASSSTCGSYPTDVAVSGYDRIMLSTSAM